MNSFLFPIYVAHFLFDRGRQPDQGLLATCPKEGRATALTSLFGRASLRFPLGLLTPLKLFLRKIIGLEMRLWPSEGGRHEPRGGERKEGRNKKGCLFSSRDFEPLDGWFPHQPDASRGNCSGDAPKAEDDATFLSAPKGELRFTEADPGDGGDVCGGKDDLRNLGH